MNRKILRRASTGFTLMELLIAIGIVGVLVGISSFAIRGAQSSARDGRRKADLETIAVALELYRADCGSYPSTLGSSITGNCPNSRVYLDSVPVDPRPPRQYSYSLNSGRIVLCASLEDAPIPPVNTAGCGSCGSGFACNWRVSKP